ncbi:hypothetical protein RRG08_003476 [Elysia crispata]|uniref:Uncharacterized protein n=1 Tax=Elysia crispata TaxID=231223 RepID=A0AAE0Y6C6_9GAST|nr:hypothetical protein RRG08_003476 [Elysia crispata]
MNEVIVAVHREVSSPERSSWPPPLSQSRGQQDFPRRLRTEWAVQVTRASQRRYTVNIITVSVAGANQRRYTVNIITVSVAGANQRRYTVNIITVSVAGANQRRYTVNIITVSVAGANQRRYTVNIITVSVAGANQRRYTVNIITVSVAGANQRRYTVNIITVSVAGANQRRYTVNIITVSVAGANQRRYTVNIQYRYSSRPALDSERTMRLLTSIELVWRMMYFHARVRALSSQLTFYRPGELLTWRLYGHKTRRGLVSQTRDRGARGLGSQQQQMLISLALYLLAHLTPRLGSCPALRQAWSRPSPLLREELVTVTRVTALRLADCLPVPRLLCEIAMGIRPDPGLTDLTALRSPGGPSASQAFNTRPVKRDAGLAKQYSTEQYSQGELTVTCSVCCARTHTPDTAGLVLCWLDRGLYVVSIRAVSAARIRQSVCAACIMFPCSWQARGKCSSTRHPHLSLTAREPRQQQQQQHDWFPHQHTALSTTVETR